MDSDFFSIFRQIDAPTARGKYLSRIFGIFSEEIVRLWASHPQSPYEDLGRPTVGKRGEKGSTLDFALRDKHTGKTYVAELKCEIEYENYKYLILSEPWQLDHHCSKAAFLALLNAAAKKPEQQIFVNRKEIQIDGAILIWGAATPEGRRAVMDAAKFLRFSLLPTSSMI